MRYLLFLSLFALLFSCKPIEPIVPTQRVIATPKINNVISTLNIPVQIDLKKQLKSTEESLPKTFEGKEDHCEGVSLYYKFIREPIDFKFKNTELYYEVDGKFELKLNYCPKCHELWNKDGTCTVPRIYASCGSNGEPMRKATVGYSTKIDISSAYKFQSTTDLKKFEIHDPCEITVFKYDATSQVKKQVKTQLETLKKEIDKQIEAINLKNSLDDVWSELQNPLAIGGYGFLYIEPKSIAMSELKFENHNVFMDLTMKVAPFVSTEPQEIKKTSIPNLETFKKSSGFDLAMDIHASYDSLTSYVNTAFKGKVFDLDGKKIIVKELKIEGTQDAKMLFKMIFEGSKRGILYLTGTPILDVENQKVTFSELDFDVETKNLLLKTAKWLFNKKILDEIKKIAVFDLKPMVDDSKKTINKELNTEISKGVQLNGKIDEVKINELFLGPNYLIVRTKFKGDLKLNIE
jgi:hypothetical protein